MLRAAVAAVTVLGAAALAACGSDSPDASTTTAPSLTTTVEASTSTTSASSTTSRGATTTAAGAVATPAAPPPPLPAGCTAPTADVKYTSGVATVEITSGPGAGKLDLAVQPRSRSELRASSRDLKGEWEDAAGKQLYVNVSGGDPCRAKPSAFVRIMAEGSSGPAFGDSGRNRCTVELKAFSAQGVDGSFTCTQLGGGGAGVFIDATGTFSLRP